VLLIGLELLMELEQEARGEAEESVFVFFLFFSSFHTGQRGETEWSGVVS
jgi:hypothetical protein